MVSLMFLHSPQRIFPTVSDTALVVQTYLFSRILQSLGQHLLLGYDLIASLFGSGLAERYRWINSLASSAENLNSIWILSTYRE